MSDTTKLTWRPINIYHPIGAEYRRVRVCHTHMLNLKKKDGREWQWNATET